MTELICRNEEQILNNFEVIKDLTPLEVFKYFSDLASIPHGSGNVKKISDYLVSFAESNGLKCRQDDYYNVLIKKSATAGYENRPTVILQGHIDMVAVKTDECDKDMKTEGLDLAVDGDYLYANQTSLGADDGIAVAYALAILASKDIEHPAIEAVFTVDEEIGLLGASAMDMSDVEGRILLNIDSEEEGIFTVGCAGGATVACNIPVNRIKKTGTIVDITFSDFAGGHSGVEIHCQRANANVLLGRLLCDMKGICGVSVVNVSGGEKDNAIARVSNAKLLVDSSDVDKVVSAVETFYGTVKKEYARTDENCKITATVGNVETEDVLEAESLNRVIAVIINNPNGVCKMSNDIKGLVQTSLNLGILATSNDKISVSYSVRSSVGTEKDELIAKMKHLTECLSGYCEVSGEYPAWEYKPESPLRDTFVEVYKEIYKKEPVVMTIHAGLECGVISDKLENLDAISFGPDIKDIHTTKERLSISSTKRTWEFILEVLKRIK